MEPDRKISDFEFRIANCLRLMLPTTSSLFFALCRLALGSCSLLLALLAYPFALALSFLLQAPYPLARGDLDEILGRQLLEQGQHIALALVRFNVVLPQDCILDLVHCLGFLDQSPDPGAYRIETIVHPGLEMQYDRLLVQIAGDLLLHRNHR